MPEEQRKLAAIMFTDMVGYSALTQKNESLALELLKLQNEMLRPLFPKFRGMEIKTIGDAFMVEFTSALDAVNCAIDIQKKLREYNSSAPIGRNIVIRIGIHVGDVIHRDNDVFGDGVNIASRVEPLANPGGICITEDVFRQIQNKTENEAVRLGKGNLKNIEVATSIYKIILPWEKKKHRFVELVSFYIRRRKLQVAVFALSVILVAAVSWWYVKYVSKWSISSKSIAVLPFKNLTDNKEEYFSDGITEDILTQLSKINGLKVISRTSVMHYKNSEKTIKEIAKELRVATILEGSIRKEGNKVRIVAQLINANNDEHIWADTYDREIQDIFSIQSDIANEIADALQMELTTNQKQTMQIRKQTNNPEAYQLYLKGKFFWNKRTAEGLEKAKEYFNQAIELDPGYALGYSGLAATYILLPEYANIPVIEASSKAKALAQKSLELDSTISEAYAVLALAKSRFHWDLVGAKAEFQKAVELNPNNATVHHWFCNYYQIHCQFDDALREILIAQQLDPLAPVISLNVGNAYYFMNRYDEALEQYKKVLELDEKFPPVYVSLGYVYEQKGMYKEAIDGLITLRTLVGESSPYGLEELGYMYARAGKRKEALAIIDDLRNRTTLVNMLEFRLALIYLGLGDNDKAFEWLEKAYASRTLYNFTFAFSPRWKSLRNDSRMISLMKRVGLEK